MAAMTPEAKAKKLADDRAYKRDKRANSDSFVEKEKEYRKGYARNKYGEAKLAVEFMKANALVFSEWLQNGKSVAPPPSSRMDAQSRPSMIPTMDLPETNASKHSLAMDELGTLPPMQGYAALGSQIPTADSMERRRMEGVDTTIIRQLGL